MPYVERVTKAGNTIEIERYFTSRYKKKGISRGDKVKPTKEEQEKVNTRQAERKLRILINANYGYGDYHLVLDYIRRKGQPDRTPEQMRQDIDVFLRECRKEYRKAGLEFKYIHVMEIGKKGARHHHLVVNKIDTEILQRCWYKAYEGHKRWLNRESINDISVTLCWDNLEALCQDCHNKEHHKQERHKRYRFDENGGILPPYQKNN